MSNELIVGRRYAKALFQIAQDQNKVAEVEKDLRLVADTLNGNADLRHILLNPSISKQMKKELAQQVFGAHVSETVMNAVQLMVDKGRESLLGTLIDTYLVFANEAMEQTKAIVYSARRLSDQEVQQIAETFGRITGKTVAIEQALKPELIGGVQVRIGDRLYDGSLSGKLQRLEKTLTQQAL